MRFATIDLVATMRIELISAKLILNNRREFGILSLLNQAKIRLKILVNSFHH